VPILCRSQPQGFSKPGLVLQNGVKMSAIRSKEEGQDLLTEWERALGHPLTPTEFEELKENLFGFFNLLHEWDLQDQLEASAADGACIDSNVEGGPDD